MCQVVVVGLLLSLLRSLYKIIHNFFRFVASHIPCRYESHQFGEVWRSILLAQKDEAMISKKTTAQGLTDLPSSDIFFLSVLLLCYLICGR